MSRITGNRVAVYQPHFLSISMTFIYRQLLGVADHFRPLVLATKLNNAEHFPYDRLAVRQKSKIELIYAALLRKTSGRLAPMFSGRREFWRRTLTENKIELIHAHFGNAGIEILPLARSLNIPLLVTFHGADASNMLRNRYYVRELQSLFAYAHVITVSSTMARRLEAIGANPDRLDVHYIGAPVEDFSFVEREPLRAKVQAGEWIQLLQVSNFVEKKGHKYTIEAFKRFLDHYPRAKLVFAGDGPLRVKLESMVCDLGLTDRVEFKGAVPKSQVIELMRRADLFVHHSITARNGNQEGLPTVLMEAMSTGLPVITTVHAGIPELIRDGENGFLIDERDVDAYVDKLIASLALPTDMPRKASYTVHKDFNMSVQNEKLKTIYARFVEPSAPLHAN